MLQTAMHREAFQTTGLLGDSADDRWSTLQKRPTLLAVPPRALNAFDPSSNLHRHIARTRPELETAYTIVHDAYVKSGLMEPHPSGMRLSVYNALPHAITLVGWHWEAIAGTVTLVLDSPLGLPMDDVYGAELETLRRAGRKVAEISALAARPGLRNRNLVLALQGRAILMGRIAGVDDLCIAVHPRHVPFYQLRWLFEVLGGLRTYETVNGALAMALRLDLRTLEERSRCAPAGTLVSTLSKAFQPDSLEKLRALVPPRAIPPDVLRDFFVLKTDVLRRASRAALDFLKACYPFYDFRTILSEA